MRDLPLTIPKHVEEGVLYLDLIGNKGGQDVVPQVEEVADLIVGDKRGNVDALWDDRGVVMGDVVS